MNDWNFHLNKLGEKEQTKIKANKQKETIKIRVEINKKIIENNTKN